MKKTTNGFAKLTWAEFRKLTDVIVHCMTGNAYFPTLQTQVTALSEAVDKYHELDTKAESRDKNVLIARNTSRIELTNVLHQIGFAVSSISNGNEEMLASSGFPFTKAAQKSPPLHQPKPPKLSAGVNNGVINVKTSRQKGSISYKYFITAAENTKSTQVSADASWKVESHNATQYQFSDLIAGQRYFIKAGLVGVRSQEVVSEAVSYIAQ